MAAILRKAWDGYLFVFEELADPRTKGWLFVAKPYQGIMLLGIYLMFVLKWGPNWMKNRRPFNLDTVLIVYNALQVIACAYVFINAIRLAWGWHYKWMCEPVDFSNSPRAIEIAKLTYMYYVLKIIDLLDTVFFVLRKKNNQVSFLHIYHHAGMVALIWAAVTYLPGGHGTLVGVINSFVHVVMYSYYLLSVAVPTVKKTIWIKKLVTQLQILQFFWCVVHMIPLVLKTDCDYPRWVSAVFLPQNLFILVLFTDFYIKTYVRKPRQQLKNPKQEIVIQNNSDSTEKNKNDKDIINGNRIYNNGKKYDDINDKNKTLNEYNNISNGFVNGSKNSICDEVIKSNGTKYKKYE